MTMTRLAVIDEQDAARTRMCGSPTLLVDGEDPFAVADAPASLSCRLYPDGGVPSVRALRRVLIPAVPRNGHPHGHPTTRRAPAAPVRPGRRHSPQPYARSADDVAAYSSSAATMAL